MLTKHPAAARGRTRIDWLDSRHSFSFGDWYDPSRMGFGPLRVINEDRVEPGQGFGTHGHRDMEIVTWVLAGAVQHRDSLGTGSVIRPGDVQVMSAGTGIHHSEFNPSAVEPVHFLQIWVMPETRGVAPRYAQEAIPADAMQGKLAHVISRFDGAGIVHVHQDADVHVARLAPGDAVTHALRPGRVAWVQVAEGRVRVGDTALAAGDGASLEDETAVTITADATAEVLLFDLPSA
ncbi:MAG: pirin family protein [bacterium]|nr:pirin family protein [bacterium]